MKNKFFFDNLRLLLCAIEDAVENGASPQALGFYHDAAEALADGDLKLYVTLFALGENYASL